MADWALRNMEYSSEEELGAALHKHLGYASVAFDKAVKLAEFIAVLKADPEMHKRMQATVAANPDLVRCGREKTDVGGSSVAS